MANTLAYYDMATITAVKSFKVQALVRLATFLTEIIFLTSLQKQPILMRRSTVLSLPI